MANDNLRKMIRKHEGFRTKPYKDTLGNLTVGIGHLIKPGEEAKELSKQEVEDLFEKDLSKAQQGAQNIINKNKLDLSEAQTNALTDMVFQMGEKGVSKFKNTLKLLKQGKYEDASKEALNSRWAKQTPNRAKSISELLKQGKEMAKEKEQKSLLGPLRELPAQKEIDTVMQDLQPEAKEQLQINVEKDSTMANVQKDPKQEVAKMIQEQKVDRQPASESSLTKENIEQTRSSLDQGFKDALMYFGPRLGAMILGGTEAAEITDRVMTGFEKYQAGRQPKPIDTKQDLAERKFAFEQQKFATQQAEKEEKQKISLEKEQKENQKTMTDLNESLSKMTQAKKFLQEGGITGLFDATIRRAFERRSGSPKEQGRLILEKLALDEKLLATARTKGAISDREFKELGAGIPKMTDDESVWQDWIDTKMPIVEKAIKNLGGESTQAVSPSRARLEELRAKYGRR